MRISSQVSQGSYKAHILPKNNQLLLAWKSRDFNTLFNHLCKYKYLSNHLSNITLVPSTKSFSICDSESPNYL